MWQDLKEGERLQAEEGDRTKDLKEGERLQAEKGDRTKVGEDICNYLSMRKKIRVR